MGKHAWVDEFQASVTVSDSEGKILEMNERSCQVYSSDGGAKLIGTNLFDCHQEPALAKVKEMMNERRTNVYTIQKNGTKKLIYQAPWYKDGIYAGFVELSFEIPWDMPHFNRDEQ